jgi:flagellar hook-associated protein 3 FlgL
MFNTISTANERFLADLSNLEGRLLTAQRQVSSGLRMQSVADDPDQVSALLAVKAQIAHNSQLKYNLGRVQTEVNAAENAINTAATLMDRARQIAAQGASSTTTVDTRTQLAGQVKDIITEMFGLTQTQVEGRYVFSGDSDQTPPYLNVDLTQPNGVGGYQGSSGTRQVEHPNGSTFSISYTADQVFDSGGVSSSVFQSLTALYNDLQSSNIANLSTDADNIGMAASFLDGQQARYGEIQNQVSDAISAQQKLDTLLQTQLGNTQDADAASAIVELQKESVAQQAALQAHAALPRTSLFSFIG